MGKSHAFATTAAAVSVLIGAAAGYQINEIANSGQTAELER